MSAAGRVNSGTTSQRVLNAIRRRILARSYLPGARLDPAVLAQDLFSSITPVRDALNVLTGSGLVETGINEGFHIPNIDEPALKDLCSWNLEVLLLAIRSWPKREFVATPAFEPDDDGSAISTAVLFDAIAHRSENAEHSRAVASLNERLHPIRTIEPFVLEEIAVELAALRSTFKASDREQLRRELVTYHRRRQRKAAELVRAHYRVA